MRLDVALFSSYGTRTTLTHFLEIWPISCLCVYGYVLPPFIVSEVMDDRCSILTTSSWCGMFCWSTCFSIMKYCLEGWFSWCGTPDAYFPTLIWAHRPIKMKKTIQFINKFYLIGLMTLVRSVTTTTTRSLEIDAKSCCNLFLSGLHYIVVDLWLIGGILWSVFGINCLIGKVLKILLSNISLF